MMYSLKVKSFAGKKFHGEWQQKIILKDTDLSYILRELEVEIVTNQNVTMRGN